MTVDQANTILNDLFPDGDSPLRKELSDKKSPGLDGIPMEVVKRLVLELPYSFADMCNKVVLEEEVPDPWKEGRVVLVKKPNRDGDVPADYRPICLLNSLAKAYEKVLTHRLTQEVEMKNVLHPLQFGFRRGRSTTDAVSKLVEIATAARGGSWYTRQIPVVVMLDIRNAFNSIPWGSIFSAMEKGISSYLRRVIYKYLIGRKLVYFAADGVVRQSMHRGVPQGSIVGPTLWNLAYNNILRIPMPEGVKIIAFADDIAIIATARFEGDVAKICNTAIDRILRWLDANGLKVAPQKTVAMTLAGRRRLQDL